MISFPVLNNTTSLCFYASSFCRDNTAGWESGKYFPEPMTHFPRYLILCVLLPAILSARQGFLPPSVAPDTSGRPLLLVFSGSDWCQPCIRFEKQVLNDSAFQQFANTRLDVVKADFPQRKKLSAEQALENERLAEQYNPEGRFPHIVLLHPDRSIWAILPSNARNGGEFVEILESKICAD